uniref:Uncharacterized protein n=1 Tax=Anguilla anguilla TaxID=7936 RepID=A0A0E9P8P2_ANGAN
MPTCMYLHSAVCIVSTVVFCSCFKDHWYALLYVALDKGFCQRNVMYRIPYRYKRYCQCKIIFFGSRYEN